MAGKSLTVFVHTLFDYLKLLTDTKNCNHDLLC